MTNIKTIPSVSVNYARNGSSTKANEMGMRVMQERAYEKRGEQYLLIKSPPASGKAEVLMFIALDKLHNQGLKKAIIVVPEKSIGSSFNNEPLTKFGFWADQTVRCSNGIFATRQAMTTVARFLQSKRFLKVMIAFWFAPMPPFALRWIVLAWRRLMTA